MNAKRLKPFSAYSLVFLFGIGLALGFYSKWRRDLDTSQDNYTLESHDKSQEVATSLEHTFRLMYQGLRTMALLPGVQKIDRYAQNFDMNTRQTVQEIYNNLAGNVAMSETYIVPLERHPDEKDPHPHKLQEPITTFDQLIVGHNADQSKGKGKGAAQAEVPQADEIEIYEYRLMRKQLDWFAAHYPRRQNITGLNFPALCGPEVITSDNSRYHPSHPDDKDRSGLVFAVPFYSPEGKLKGCISGVILTHALRDLLPAGHYALCNRAQTYVAFAHQSGQAQQSGKWVTQGQPDPALRYSETRVLPIIDAGGQWRLWAGQPDTLFWSRRDVEMANRFVKSGYAGTVLLVAALWGILALAQRNRRLMERRAEELERLVAIRTQALQDANAEMEAQQTELVEQQAELEAQQEALLTANECLHKSEAHTRLVVNTALDAVITMDREGRFTGWNPQAAEMFGWAEEEILGQRVSETIIPPAYREAHEAGLARYLETGAEIMFGNRIEITGLRRDGSEFPVELAITPLGSGDAACFSAFVRDITTRKQAQERIARQAAELEEANQALEAQQAELDVTIGQLQEANIQLETLATTDGLTGLKNHRTFQERLEHEFQRTRRYKTPLSMILLDVDKFKSYNDTYGHPAGDAVLKLVAQVLLASVRATDLVARVGQETQAVEMDFVARYGGEEFVIVLPNTDKAGALVAAERFRAAIEAAPWVERAVTASFGVSTMTAQTANRAQLIAQADAALYASKQGGRNRVTHFTEIPQAQDRAA